jgi:hypothetical protein
MHERVPFRRLSVFYSASAGMFVGTDRAPPYGQGHTLDNRGTRSYGESVFQLHALYRARTSLWQKRTLRDASGSQDHIYIQVPKGAASGGDQRPTESASEPERHLIPNHSTILTAIKSNVLATSRTKMIQSFIFFFGTTRKKRDP